ncbi:helix-turn-helix domain-containing protein [Kitasatospora gansuensis]|uniref:helix-turn-helix domain-containing protein n=1 Tax=Kitasatospora gansuensis TaxID=258050 RepID=UPI0028AC146C|nr:helix-turn-helix domain-containing protein [Kitasatospora gansuensis]
MMESSSPLSPVLSLEEAAAYIRRTPKALRCLRERRTAPAGFRTGGRVMFRRAELDDWLAKHEAQDSRTNPALDPTRVAPEPRRRRPARQLAA